MNCEFCNNPLTYSHKENRGEIEVYDCRHCPTLVSFYYFQKEGTRLKTVFMIDRKEKLYIWTNNYIKNCSYITDLSPKEGLSPNPKILEIPKILPINPSNVLEKFKFYMMFL